LAGSRSAAKTPLVPFSLGVFRVRVVSGRRFSYMLRKDKYPGAAARTPKAKEGPQARESTSIGLKKETIL